jgi:hypothetical protein
MKGPKQRAIMAARQLREWLDGDGQGWGEREEALSCLLIWAEAQLFPKARNGSSVSTKGYEFERSTVNDFRACGFECSRVPLSGAGEEKGDIRLKTGWDQVYKGEAKIRKSLPSYLTTALDAHDFTVFREDRGKSFVLITLERFKELVQ